MLEILAQAVEAGELKASFDDPESCQVELHETLAQQKDSRNRQGKVKQEVSLLWGLEEKVKSEG